MSLQPVELVRHEPHTAGDTEAACAPHSCRCGEGITREMKPQKSQVHKAGFRREMPWGDMPKPAQGAPGSRECPTPSGILLIDKPSGVTSHDVVGAVRRLAGTRKVGHAGTLDPMATGLLTVGIGAGTKLLTYMSGHDKTYRATIRFGVATSTEDADGELLLDTLGLRTDIDTTQIDAAMAALTGEIQQRPSAVSAIKIDGERAYERVRRGEDVDIPARPVTVHNFIRLGQPRPAYIYQLGRQLAPALDIDVEAACSAGTYIRALARDLGEALGMGAHLTMLRRVRVGEFDVTAASSMTDLRDCVRAEKALPVMPLAQAACAALPSSVTVTPEQARALRHGQFIELESKPRSYPVALMLQKNETDSGASAHEELIAVGKKRGKLVAPDTVFAEN